MFSKIVEFIRLRTKPFGYLTYLDCTISDKEIRDRRIVQQDNSQKDIVNAYARIFQWPSFYWRFDRDLLKEHFRRGYMGIYVYGLSVVFRFIHSWVDLVHYIISWPKNKYVISERIRGNVESEDVIVTYSKGKAREDIFSESNQYKVIDIYVDTKNNDGFECKDSFNVSFNFMWKVIKKKMQFPYISVSNIELILVSEKAFSNRLSLIKSTSNSVDVFVREGVTPINRVLVEAAHGQLLNTVTFFTNTFFCKKFPVYTKTILINKDLGIRCNSYVEKIAVLGGNPYIDWRKISKTNKSPCLGVIPDTGFFGFKRKKLTDELMIKALLKFPEFPILLRPHPTCASSEKELSYYNGLIGGCENIHIDEANDIEGFLRRVTVVVTNSESGSVEQALLCKIPVIVVREEESLINDDISTYADEMIRICQTENEIEEAIEYFSNVTNNELNLMWNKFLYRVGYDDSSMLDIDNVVNKALSI